MIFETFIIALLMVIAIALLLLEIFMLPGITVAGIGGLLFAAGGLIYAYSVSTCVGHVTLGASLVAFAAAFAWLMRSKSFSRVALNTDIDSRLTSSRELGIVPGDEGVTRSRPKRWTNSSTRGPPSLSCKWKDTMSSYKGKQIINNSFYTWK